MKLIQTLMFAGALVAATPAVTQDNAAVSANAVEANAALATPTTAAATPGAQNATLPGEAAAPAPADEGGAPVENSHHGFPWGVLGILGLIGLLGVRKVKS